MELAMSQQRKITDDLDALLNVLPISIVESVHKSNNYDKLLEIILDLGRVPTARFVDSEITLREAEVTAEELAHVVQGLSEFDADNRSGIERTLHRISAIRNRRGAVVGLTLRVGHAVYGTVDIIQDIIESGKSVLILGRPGVGKTTLLREAARILAESKRVVIVDTSNEIGGERVDIIPFDDNPAQFVINAMQPAEVTSIVVDEDSHSMDIAVAEEKLSQAIGRGGQNIRLASELTGWRLNIMSEQQAEEKSEGEARALKELFMKQLDVDEDVATILVQEGLSSIEEVAYVPASELLSISEFDEEIVKELRNRARDVLLTQAIAGLLVDLPERHPLGAGRRRVDGHRAGDERQLEVALPVRTGRHGQLHTNDRPQT